MDRARMHWIVFGLLRGYLGFAPRYQEVADFLDRLTPDEVQRLERCQELEDRLLMGLHKVRESIADSPESPPREADPALTTWVQSAWREISGEHLSRNEARAVASALSLEERDLIREALRQIEELRRVLLTRQ